MIIVLFLSGGQNRVDESLAKKSHFENLRRILSSKLSREEVVIAKLVFW